jgi:Flp pilus assembly protein TadG
MKRERGHAMLELAISSSVMMACLAGTFQFGYTFYVYNQLVTAVGNGGRYAAMRTYRGGKAGQTDKGAQAIRNMVVFGDAQPAPDAQPAVANLTTGQVDVHWVMDEKGAPTAVSVSIKSFDVNAVFRKFTFTGRPGVEFPFVGRYAPGEPEP